MLACRRPYAPTQTVEGEDIVTEADCKYHGWHIPSKKLRVMLLSEDTLHQILDEPLPTPAFERPTHHPRWVCLRDMARLQRVRITPPPARVAPAAKHGRRVRGRGRGRGRGCGFLEGGGAHGAACAATGRGWLDVEGASVAARPVPPQPALAPASSPFPR